MCGLYKRSAPLPMTTTSVSCARDLELPLLSASAVSDGAAGATAAAQCCLQREALCLRACFAGLALERARQGVCAASTGPCRVWAALPARQREH